LSNKSEKILTVDLQRGGHLIAVGLGRDHAAVLNLAILDDQLPLLPLRDDLYSEEQTSQVICSGAVAKWAAVFKRQYRYVTFAKKYFAKNTSHFSF
jgi:hypothetical protein